MTNEVQLYRDGDQVTIAVGGQQASMGIGVWSKLIANPKSPNVFSFPRHHEPMWRDAHDELPSDSERKD